jgi:hypothetical protein
VTVTTKNNIRKLARTLLIIFSDGSFPINSEHPGLPWATKAATALLKAKDEYDRIGQGRKSDEPTRPDA